MIRLLRRALFLLPWLAVLGARGAVDAFVKITETLRISK